MLPAVPAHIDKLSGQRNCTNSSRNHVGWMCDKGYYRAVVIRIHMRIQHARSLCASDRCTQALNSFSVAAFAEVWYTLNEIAD